MLYLGLINFIKDRINNASLSDLVPFIIGLIFGFVFCLLIYAIIILTSFKKSEKKAQKVVIKVDDEIIKNKIQNARNEYVEEATSVKAGEKVNILKDTCWTLINDIARVYYPDSKHPIFELSVEELINLDYYIMQRIDKLFSKKVLSMIRKLQLSTVINLLDTKKKIDNNKVVKAANKANLGGIAKGLWTAVNFINPVYWIKKVMIEAPFQVLMNKMALVIIDVVGEETSIVYSKGAFVKENDEVIEKELNDLIGETIDE